MRLLALLACAFAGPVRSAETRAVLGSAAEVRSLATEAAAEARPVRLQGQLLLVTISRNALVLLDRGEGIYVQLDRPVDRQLRQGDEIEV
ncbi:MAG: hypothetical protein JNN01_21730, partial [Opitutaceae bacterium]|nr:hypothetical protein [Opitutaceae bacterium]